MPRPKIKVVRCGKCKKRYGAMVAHQKCPHCAKARKARGVKRSAPHRTNRISKISTLKGGRRMTAQEVVRSLGRKRVGQVYRKMGVFKGRNPRRLSKTIEPKSQRLPKLGARARRRRQKASWYGIRAESKREVRQRRMGSNPSGQHLFKKFHGMRSTKTVQVRTSKHMPSNGSWILGPINYLKVRKGNKVQRVDFGPRARLVGYGKRLLAIGNAQFKQHRGVNPSEHGLVPVEVGYEKRAPHLNDGYTGLTPWKHRFGEESGRMPCLHIDHEGFAVIKGGGFHIKADGIHD